MGRSSADLGQQPAKLRPVSLGSTDRFRAAPIGVSASSSPLPAADGWRGHSFDQPGYTLMLPFSVGETRRRHAG
jgi:hypothetical protein